MERLLPQLFGHGADLASYVISSCIPCGIYAVLVSILSIFESLSGIYALQGNPVICI